VGKWEKKEGFFVAKGRRRTFKQLPEDERGRL